MEPGDAAGAVNSVDAVQDVLSRAYRPLRLDPAQPDAFRADVITRRVGRVTLGRLGFGSEIRIRTADITDYHLDVTVAGCARSVTAREQETVTTPGTATTFSPDGPAKLWWSPGTVQWAIMFGHEVVLDELTNLLGRAPTRPMAFVSRSQGLQPRPELQQALKLLESFADDEYLSGNPLLARRLEQTAIGTLLLTAEHTYSAELVHRSARMPVRQARRALDMLHAEPSRDWTVGILAHECGVSVRSLYEGFRDVAGTSPMNYLQQLRIDSAHDMLLHGDGELTVAAVAHRWGFAHLGRFAAAYRKRFGESPSETLRRER